MAQTDFYLASSGLIPLLALAPTIAKQLTLTVPESRARIVEPLNRQGPRV